MIISVLKNSKKSLVNLKIFNILGTEILTLVEGEHTPESTLRNLTEPFKCGIYLIKTCTAVPVIPE